ncbi:MAG: polyprenyl synthetase family protein [Saprospiraceae bacterium]
MQTLSQFQAVFQEYHRNHPFSYEPFQLYEPVDYILGLGGKRIRPVLLLMGYHLFDNQVVKVLPAAYAIEIFHNFTLLHDDIMDEAPLRRGKPTVHHKYDVNTGILSGDVMLIYAYEYILQMDKQLQPLQLMQIFNRVAREVCEGQQLDMNFETQEVVEISEYLRMIELKTAVLLGAALEMGAVAAGANKKDARNAAEFGRKIGIAFQLQDDILDTFGDPEKFGKKVGGDIAQNKKTYLYLRALEVATLETRTELTQLYFAPNTDETAKIKRVTELFTQLNIKDLATELMQQYQQEAFAHLAAIEVPQDRKQVLIDTAEMLFGRES